MDEVDKNAETVTSTDTEIATSTKPHPEIHGKRNILSAVFACTYEALHFLSKYKKPRFIIKYGPFRIDEI